MNMRVSPQICLNEFINIPPIDLDTYIIPRTLKASTFSIVFKQRVPFGSSFASLFDPPPYLYPIDHAVKKGLLASPGYRKGDWLKEGSCIPRLRRKQNATP
jgi:hypothetical protein